MKRILVPTDFSEPSQRSYKFALDLAEAIEGEVFVLHLIDIPLMQETTFGIQPPPIGKSLLKPFEEKASAIFKYITKKYPTTVPVHFFPAHREVVPGILSFAETKKIDLIVMSTHGASGFDEFFTGSTAEIVARYAPVPVLATEKKSSFHKIKNIVFPNTLEPGQTDLVRRLKQLQAACRAKLHVLLVNTPAHFHTDAEARRLLDDFAHHHNLENCTLNHRSNQSEVAGIADFMEEVRGDMVAMATHGRIGLARFVKGSIAESVADLVEKPVWTMLG